MSWLSPFTAFFICLLPFVLLARWLTAPSIRMRAGVRAALGGLAVAGVSLGMIWLKPSPWTYFAVMAAAAFASLGMRGAGLATLTAALGAWRFPVFLLAVAAFAVLIYVCVPITTFLTSPGELDLSLDFLVRNNARDAMMFVYASALLYALAFTPRMRTALAIVALATLLLGLVYAYALPFGYPMMSGLTFEHMPVPMLERVGRVLVDVIVVGALCMGLGTLIVRVGGRRLAGGIVMVSLSLGVVAGISVRQDRAGAAGGPENEGSLVTQPLRLSRGQPNTLVIFLDRFMGSYVEQIMASDPDIGEAFSGFTWYPRSVAAGQNSIAGVHPLLGGYDYLPVEMNSRGRPLLDQSVEAFSILPYNFSRKGYQVNMVSPRGLGFTMAGDCRHLRMPGVRCAHIPKSIASRRAMEMGFPMAHLERSNYTDLLVVLAGMRGTPYAFKELLLRKGPWRRLMDHSAGTTFREWAELEALGAMTRTDAASPTFNFVSNILPHEPYYLGEDCLPRRARFELRQDEVARRGHLSMFSLQHAVTARCSLLLVGKYMQFLKQQGVYDNTRIVVASDHGIVGRVADTSTRAIAGGTQGNEYVRTRSLLLVKPRGATGPLQVSETFLPNAEVPRIVCEDIGGCVNPYLANRPIATDGRDDPFQVSLVPWQFNAQKSTAFVIEAQYELRGKDPYDAKGWKRVDRPATR